MRRFIAAWEKAIQAHLLTQEWTMFVSRLHLSPEEQDLFRGFLRAMIKPQTTMPLSVVDDLAVWALGEVEMIRSLARNMDRSRFHELQALANGLARTLAYQSDWSAAAIAEDPSPESRTGEPDNRPTLPAPEPRATVPVPADLSENLLAQCRVPGPAALPGFSQEEVPTARASDVSKILADIEASECRKQSNEEAEVTFGQDFVDLELDDMERED